LLLVVFTATVGSLNATGSHALLQSFAMMTLRRRKLHTAKICYAYFAEKKGYFVVSTI